MPNPVAWFEIYVQDLQRARRFYESVLGITLGETTSPIEGTNMLSFPSGQDSYGATGALMQVPGVPSRPGGTMVYFSCEDCTAEESRVAAAGGKVEKPTFSIAPFGRIAIVTDTEGNMLGLHSMN